MATQPHSPDAINGKGTGSGAAKRIRKVFGNIHEVVQMPNLIEVQRESYEQFLRSDPSIGYVSGAGEDAAVRVPDRGFRRHGAVGDRRLRA